MKAMRWCCLTGALQLPEAGSRVTVGGGKIIKCSVFWIFLIQPKSEGHPLKAEVVFKKCGHLSSFFLGEKRGQNVVYKWAYIKEGSGNCGGMGDDEEFCRMRTLCASTLYGKAVHHLGACTQKVLAQMKED